MMARAAVVASNARVRRPPSRSSVAEAADHPSIDRAADPTTAGSESDGAQPKFAYCAKIPL